MAKGSLPCDRRRQRNTAMRNMRTAPATRPVAMPTIDAFCSWPGKCDALAVAFADVEVLDVFGWLATVIIVESAGVDSLVGSDESGVTDEGSVAEFDMAVGRAS